MKRSLSSKSLAKADPRFAAGLDLKGKDFSGSEVIQSQFRQRNFFEAIFNGCNIRGVMAQECVFQHTEFTESHVIDSTFEDTSFDHSDFVLSLLRKVRFIRCTFQNAEWRDTLFDHVEFRQCVFRNTTASLLQFRQCRFDPISSNSFVGPSKRFNTFGDCVFDLQPDQVDFLRTNFGLYLSDPVRELQGGGRDAMFALSLYEAEGSLSAKTFAGLLNDELQRVLAEVMPGRVLSLRHLVAITRLLVEQNRFSVLAIQYLHERISSLAVHASDQNALLELASLLMALQLALRERMDTVSLELAQLPQIKATQLCCTVVFASNVDSESARRYVDMVCSLASIDLAHVTIRSVRPGSTVVDFLVAAPVFIPILVRAIKYSLASATLILKEATALKRQIIRYRSTGAIPKIPSYSHPRSSSLPASRGPGKAKKVPLVVPPTVSSLALRQPGAAIREVLQGPSEESREIALFVRTHGSTVLSVEGPAEITIKIPMGGS
jgi:Pentapeptide repeats (9 copies)